MSARDGWTIINTRTDSRSLAQFNAVFTVSNGYLGLTGNLQEDRGGRQPVTLINGVYDELDMFGLLRLSAQERPYLDPDYFDSAGKSPAVANLPSPLHVRVFVDDHEVALPLGTVTNFEQKLCLRSGIYSYAFDFRDTRGRTTRLTMSRFATLAHPHRVYMRYTVTPLDHDSPVRIESGITGRVCSNATSERQFHVLQRSVSPDGRVLLSAQTPARGVKVLVGLHNVCADSARPRGLVEADAAHVVYEFRGSRAQPIVLDRFIALASSEDEKFGSTARVDAELDAAAAQGFPAALEEQTEQWRRLWERADVQIEGDDLAQLYLRFCTFHALAAAPRHTDRLSVPVKLLTGEYYQGNTFYDTDLYLLPLYTFVLPDTARACINWRHIGLEPGRGQARELGCQGAKLAWQAGPFGEECLGDWYRFTRTNIHVNSAAIYALMQYYQAVGDDHFMAVQGIELLVETARFFAARVTCDNPDGACHIQDVTGPDEGHCRSTDNFYTNYLAAWNLRTAARMADDVRALSGGPTSLKRLDVTQAETEIWRRIAERLVLLRDPQTGVYEQCAGFFKLPPAPLDLLDERKEWFETVFPYQALNQPDVLMAMMLFRDEFDTDSRWANWEYYKDKSMNFSSMSYVINSIMAADVGELDEAYRNFIIAAGLDLDETLTGRGDTYAGLHGTAAGGAWMAAVQGFGGVCLSGRGLRISPKLPPAWRRLCFNIIFRGQVLRVCVEPGHVEVTATRKQADAVSLTIAGRAVTLAGGESFRAPLED
ncbi:MAG: glycosyl hydrolase family 65 protein [Planctomycetota bacterium]